MMDAAQNLLPMISVNSKDAGQLMTPQGMGFWTLINDETSKTIKTKVQGENGENGK